MKDRKTLLTLLAGAVLLEGYLWVRSGLASWLISGPHTAEQFRNLLVDWRTVLSVVLLSIILWLAYRWIRIGVKSKAGESEDPMSE